MRGKYVAAAFCKKLSGSTDENDLIRANIQIYDVKQEKRVQKFENSYGKKFNHC